MAHRPYTQFRYSLERKVVDIFGEYTLSSGTPTAVSGRTKGIASLARNSTGNYTLTLSDPYHHLLDFNVALVTASTGISAALVAGIVTKDVTSASKTVNFVLTTAGGGSATDPSDGSLLVHLVLADTAY